METLPTALTWGYALANIRRFRAEVVELVDALRSGRSGRKPVGVRVPPSACQYRGTDGSTLTDHASIPPLRLRTFAKPAAFRICSAFSDRTP